MLEVSIVTSNMREKYGTKAGDKIVWEDIENRIALRKPPGEILDKLESMPAIPNMRVFDDDYARRAILLARETGQSCPDAYITVAARDRNIGVVGFNKKHFSKLGADLYPL